MIKYLFLILMFVIFTPLFPQPLILETYVEDCLKHNLAFKQKQFSLEQSLQALKQARGMFLPAIGIEARYSRAGGGRLIELPIGDLMNPVYATLNQILTTVGQPPRFPTNIPNEVFPFLREEEHETKIRLIQPIFQPALLFNYKIKTHLKQAKTIELEIFKKQLIRDLKTAYFNYLKTVHVVRLFEKTHLLLQENLRVSEKLFQYQKATEEVVFQARTEITTLEQQQTEAEKNMKLAAAYFNFLMNRPFETPIEIIDETALNFNHEIDFEQILDTALQNRLEFPQLHSALAAVNNQARLARTSFLPGITGVLDYGFQGEKYRFTEEDDYWMASAVLNWNLFNGFQDQARLQQARLEQQKLETQFIELQQQIKLQVQEAFDNFRVARKAIQSASEKVASTRNTFKIIHKKYEQGMAPQIEFLNARTNLTNAEVSQIIAKYDYQIKYIELQRSIGR